MACHLFALFCCIAYTATVVLGSSAPAATHYRAAILEHDILPYASSILESMLANVNVYKETTAKAKQMGADILVFPEYGIAGLVVPLNLTEEEYADLYIYLPNEAVGHWIPCDQPRKYGDGLENYQVLEILSCAARNNSLVLVANVLTNEPCNGTEEPACPNRGFFRFNTNIIFNKDGTLLARYHKRHLSAEDFLNPSPPGEFQIIDVGFMKFGTFICYDALYADPAVEYVTKAGIKNLMFSTAWANEFPYLTAPQLYSGYARGLGVNFIAANAFVPKLSRLGSGIYSSVLGAINETNDLAMPGRLLVAELPINPQPVPNAEFDCSFSAVNESLPRGPIRNHTLSMFTNQPSSSPAKPEHLIYFQNLQNFSRIFLEAKEGSASLCEGDLCCQIEYSFDKDPNEEVYAFAMQSAIRPYSIYQFYVQVCSVLRCESKDITTCGKVPEKSTSVKFNRLSITGSFATTTVFPSILATDLLSFPDSEWEFTKGVCSEQQTQFKLGGKIALISSASKPILAATLYGRVYERD